MEHEHDPSRSDHDQLQRLATSFKIHLRQREKEADMDRVERREYRIEVEKRLRALEDFKLKATMLALFAVALFEFLKWLVERIIK